MKKTYIYVLAVVGILIILSVSTYFVIRFVKGGRGSGGSIAKNDPAIEQRVSLAQGDLYTSVFSTNEDDKNDILNVHFALNPNVNWSVTSKITDFEISNIVTDFKVGDQIDIFPTHYKSEDNCYSYMYTSCHDNLKAKDYVNTGNKHSFALVEGFGEYRDEVSSNGSIMPNFRVVLKNLATISEQTILNRDKIFESNKLAQYAGLSDEQLSGTMSFDVKIVFEDGEVFRKRYIATVDGNKAKTDPSYFAQFLPVE